MQDHGYFRAIVDQLNSGGREALLHHLLNFDLSTVNLRVVPKTMALLEQKLESLRPEEKWWLDTLMRGELPWGCDAECCCPRARLIDAYLEHAKNWSGTRRSAETRIGMFLSEVVPELRTIQMAVKHWNEARQEMRTRAERCYAMPPLVACRAAFAGRLQQTPHWLEVKDWTKEGAPDDEDESDGSGFQDGLPY
jgi:hypothetical protein